MLFLCILPACAAAPTAAIPTQTGVSTPASSPTAALSPTQLPPTATLPPPTEAPTTPPATETPLPPAPVPVDFAALQVINQFEMLDARAGWALTRDALLRTSDAGQSWSDVTPPALVGQGAPMTASFLDASHAALIAADPLAPDRAQFFTTQDGGASWATTTAPFGIANLYFLDPQHGFALVSLEIGAGQNPVAVYRTDDGGATWTELFRHHTDRPPAGTELPIGGYKSGISFADAAHGWIAGSEPVEGLIYLYRSEDGGKTWVQQVVPLSLGTEKDQYDTLPPRFFKDGKGVLVAQAFLPEGADKPFVHAFYTASDQGSRWNLASAVPATGPVAVASATDWFIWDKGRLEVTQDGGRTWEVREPHGLDGVELPSRLVFATPTDGWLISVETGNAALFHTLDGGQHWQRLTH